VLLAQNGKDEYFYLHFFIVRVKSENVNEKELKDGVLLVVKKEYLI